MRVNHDTVCIFEFHVAVGLDCLSRETTLHAKQGKGQKCLFVIYKAWGKPQSQRKTNGLGAAETFCAYACRIQKHTRSDVNSFRLLDHASIFIELQYMCIAFLLIMHNPFKNLTRKRKCRRFCTNFCGNLEHVNFRWWQNQMTTVFCCSYSALQWGPFLSNPSSQLYHLLMHSSPL